MTIELKYESYDKNKPINRTDEAAWVLYQDKVGNNTEDVWEFTNIAEEIAEAIDVVFAEDKDEAMSKIRTRYPEEVGTPVTYLKETYNRKERKYRKKENYSYSHNKSIAIVKTPALAPRASLEDLKEYLRRIGGKIELRNFNDIIKSSYYYSEDNIIKERSVFYDLGLALTISTNSIEYNPKKASTQKKRMLSYYKNKNNEKRLIISDITALAYSMKSHISAYINNDLDLDSGWSIRPSWNTQVASYNVGGVIRLYAFLFDRIFGKGSYRNLDHWKKIKKGWSTLSPSKKKNMGSDFVEWMTNEFKKSATRADITKPKL